MKELFVWDSGFSTGLVDVDAQHKHLIEVINTGIQLCLSNKEITLDDVLSLKSALTDYTVYHFDCEESLMEKHGVDERHVSQHKKIHQNFISQIKKFFAEPETLTRADALGNVMEYLIRWLAYHILNTDKSFAFQMESISNGVDPKDAFERDKKKTDTSSEPLLRALKALFVVVSEKNSALLAANADLEKKVQLRTSELEKANARLQELSIRDELTKLPNRRFAIQTIEQAINVWERYQTLFSIMYIDVDSFKAINDTFGHDKGDFVLQWLANFLRTNLRKSDVVCRLGGDEFVVICLECDKETAFVTAHHLLERIKLENAKKAIPFWQISLSIGVVEIDSDCADTTAILKKADAKMYESKEQGGNSVH